jgi:hypothetical protein
MDVLTLDGSHGEGGGSQSFDHYCAAHSPREHPGRTTKSRPAGTAPFGRIIRKIIWWVLRVNH